MKTPREVIADTDLGKGRKLGHDFAHYIEERLNAAGYVIVSKEPTGAQRQLFAEMVEAGDDFSEIYPAVLNEWC